MGRDPDYTVKIVDADGNPDQTVAVIDGIDELAPVVGDTLVWDGTKWVNQQPTGGGATGPAGGVLSGTYPDPGFAVDMATQAELNAVAAAAQPVDSDLSAIAALSTTAYGRALLALADAAAGRTAFGLGTASTHAHGDYDAAGAAAAAQAASQPSDSDLTAIAALSTTSFGRSFLDRADAAAGRTLLGLGTAATSASSAFETAGAAAAAQAAAVQRANHTGTQLAATISDLGNLLPWLIDINPVMTPIAATGTWAVIQVATATEGGILGNTSNAQNDAAAWDVVLGAGTWTLEAKVGTNTDAGIITAALDDGAGVFTDIGTMDLYSALLTYDALKTITGIVVVSTIKRRLRFKMATKNGSSSGYIARLQHLQLRRTA